MIPTDLKPTNTTPAIVYNENKLIIKGRSIPLSEAKFYDPYIEWAKDFKAPTFMVDINLEYMNSSSSKKLLHLLRSLDSNLMIKDLNINWFFENGDEEALEQGKVFEKLMKNAKFRFIKYQ
jgi:hypothetical protein